MGSRRDGLIHPLPLFPTALNKGNYCNEICQQTFQHEEFWHHQEGLSGAFYPWRLQLHSKRSMVLPIIQISERSRIHMVLQTAVKNDVDRSCGGLAAQTQRGIPGPDINKGPSIQCAVHQLSQSI